MRNSSHYIRMQTWKLTKQTENLLKIAQRAMEKAMLGITQRDRKRSTWVREKTRVKGIIQKNRNGGGQDL